MNAYRITLEQKNAIENQLFAPSQFFNPVQDINGDWFIFKQEFKQCGLGVLTDFIPPPSEPII
jgi:hypothetical protein